MLFQGRAAQQVSVSAKVLRADGTVKEDLGRVGYWHKNPFKRLLWRVQRWLLS